VAFSGGADSLALLLLLWAHWPGRRRRLLALHFNHKLRGRAAEADEKFCRSVCAALGIDYCAGEWIEAGRALRATKRLVGSKAQGAAASEAAARAARMDFFDRELRRVRGRVLWLGHQMDDVAETLLMRLARGSGTGGLSAPRPLQSLPGGRVRLRPLLNWQKSQLTGALRAAGATWREDATNAAPNFFRNRIRHSVLPAWRAAASGRDALAGAALTRELLADDDAALDAWLDELGPLTKGGDLDLGRLAGKPRALARRALHRWLGAQRGAGDLSRQGFESLLAAIQRGLPARHSLGVQGFAIIRRGRLVYGRRKLSL
jgi:tRNA(Ile)-lysidine synthase